jgi:hypothetical protein
LARATFERASTQVYGHTAMIFSSLLAMFPTQQEVDALREQFMRDLEAGRSGG